MTKADGCKAEAAGSDTPVDDIHAALQPDRIIVSVSAYPLMESESVIGGLAFRFLQRNGATSVVVIPREECGMIQRIFEDLNQIDWRTPDSLVVESTRVN